MAIRPGRFSGRMAGASRSNNVAVWFEMSPDFNNPAENMHHMREAMMRNLHERVAVPLAMRMEKRAKSNVPWEPQPPHIHNKRHGYDYDHAHRQIVGYTINEPATDTILIALAHSPRTVQRRKNGPVYYGNILEYGHGGDQETNEPGRFGVINWTVDEHEDDILAMMAGSLLDGIDFKGARAPRRRGR